MHKAVKLCLALLLLTLAGCSDTFNPVKSGIKPVRSEFGVKIIHRPLMKSSGYFIFDPSTNTCIIYLKNPPICEIHEYLHCRYGYWHDEKPNGEHCNDYWNK